MTSTSLWCKAKHWIAVRKILIQARAETLGKLAELSSHAPWLAARRGTTHIVEDAHALLEILISDLDLGDGRVYGADERKPSSLNMQISCNWSGI